GRVGPLHLEVPVQDQDRLWHRGHDDLAGLSRYLQLGLVPAYRGDVEQREHGPVDLVFDVLVGPDSQRIGVLLVVVHLALADGHGIDHLHDQGLEVRALDVGLDVADGSAHVGGDQVQQLLGRGGEPADLEVRGDHDDGDVNAGQEVDEVAVDVA